MGAELGELSCERKFSRGLEFATQPYDEPRSEAIAKNGMFGACTFRWLPAKSAIHSSFLMFYARTPADFGKVETLRFENGVISIEDGAKHKIAMRASLPLSDQP